MAYTLSNELFRAVEGAKQKIQCDQHDKTSEYSCIVDECMDTYKCLPLDMVYIYVLKNYTKNFR